MLRCAADHRVRLHLVAPGTPTQNAYIETFNGRFRDDCLNESESIAPTQARELIDDWRLDYKRIARTLHSAAWRPRSSAASYQLPTSVRIRGVINAHTS